MNPQVQRLILIIFLIYTILGTYLLAVAFKNPVINIRIYEENNKWFISSIEDKVWANKYNISIDNEIIEVNGVDINLNTEVIKRHLITDADSITINSNDTQKTIKITYFDFTRQFLLRVIIPTIYFTMSLIICINYLSKGDFYNRKKNLLIILLMTMSIAYISGNASSKFDFIGLVVNTTFITISLTVLIQFLNNYLYIPFINKIIKITYIVPIVLFLINGASYWYNICYRWGTILTLSSIIVSGIIIIYLMWIMYKRSNEKVRHVVHAILLPVLPFILLYCLPLILTNEPIIEADIATLGLIILPFSILFTNLTEKLFDIKYYINRLQYYSLLAICTSFIITYSI